MSKHRLFFAGLGVLALAAVASAGFVLTGSADILHLDSSRNMLSASAKASRNCWQWSAGAKDWTWVCRVGAYRGAYPVNPYQPPTAVAYDYPSYGPGITGSSLAFVAGRSSLEHIAPPPHAD